MATVSVRYIVNDVDEAIRVYCQHLGEDSCGDPVDLFQADAAGGLALRIAVVSSSDRVRAHEWDRR